MSRNNSEDEDNTSAGLICGITAYHIRILVDDPFCGGKGQQLSEVAKMTLDQVFMLLADRGPLGSRCKTISSTGINSMVGRSGIKGRSADGKPIIGRIDKKSLARQLMDRKRAREAAEKDTRRRIPKGKGRRK